MLIHNHHHQPPITIFFIFFLPLFLRGFKNNNNYTIITVCKPQQCSCMPMSVFIPYNDLRQLFLHCNSCSTITEILTAANNCIYKQDLWNLKKKLKKIPGSRHRSPLKSNTLFLVWTTTPHKKFPKSSFTTSRVILLTVYQPVNRGKSITSLYKNLSYRKHIARQLRTQYVEGIYDNRVTLKSRLTVTQGHWKRNHWDHTRLTISRVIGCWILS